MAKDYAERFGEIDSQAQMELRDTHIRVIPCPEHKSHPKGWVHETVPLLEKKAARGALKAAS